MKEINFNLEFENFFCPITGQQVLDPGQLNPSPAMVFAYLHNESIFEHLNNELEEQFSEEFKDEDKHGDLYVKLTKKTLIANQNYLWITHGLGTFGDVSFCFDMGYKVETEDEESHPFYDLKNFSSEDNEEV